MALNAWDTRRITYAAMMDSVQPILSYYPHPSPQNVMDMDSGSLRTNNYTGTHIPWPAQQRNYSTCDTYTTPIKQELNSNTEEFPEYNSVPNNLFNTIPLTPSPESVRTEHHFQENRTVPTANPVCYDNQLTPPDCTPNSNTLRTCLYRTNENQTEQRTPVRSIVSLIETPSNSPTLSAGNHENPCKDDEAVSNIEAGSDEKLYSDEDDLDGIYVRQFNSHGKMRTYKCKKCSLVMDTRAELWRHLETHLDASKILRCPKAPKCPFVTVLKHYLEYHIRHHNQEKPYECSKCNYRCINKSMLNSHMKSHSGLYQYSCKDCDYATKYCHSLKVHLRKYMHEPGLVLDEDGVPDPTIIIDVNGRRRGPRGKKGRVSRELKPQLSAISQAPKEEDDLKDDSSVSEEPQKSQATKVPSTPEKSPLPPSTHPYLPAPTFNPGIVQNTLPNPLMNLFQQNLHLLPYLQALFIQRNNFLSTLSSGPPMPIKYPMEDRDGASAMDLSQNSPDKLEKWENNHSDSAEENSTSNLTWQNGKKPHHKDYDYEDQKIRQSTPAATPTSTPTPPPISSPSSTDLQGIHHCPHCDIFFKNVILFSLHMGYHTCGDVFKCNMCGERCENAVQFSIHLAVKRHDTSNM